VFTEQINDDDDDDDMKNQIISIMFINLSLRIAPCWSLIVEKLAQLYSIIPGAIICSPEPYLCSV